MLTVQSEIWSLLTKLGTCFDEIFRTAVLHTSNNFQNWGLGWRWETEEGVGGKDLDLHADSPNQE